jgi:hypothetical protein
MVDIWLHAGVYGTKLPPSAGKRAIAKNNWVQGWKNREKRGRVDYYFRYGSQSTTVIFS